MLRVGLLSSSARLVLAAALGFTLLGMLVVAPGGCTTDNYECGDRVLNCEFAYDEPTCGQRNGCKWRSGCEKPCAEQPAPCVTPCWNATQGFPIDAPACQALSSDGCSWVPSCWEDPAQLCERDLSEDECQKRGCRWEKVGPKL